MKSNFGITYGHQWHPLRFDLGGHPCPVCGTEMKHSYSFCTEGIVGESEEECPNGCYYLLFAYGNTDITITIREHHVTFYSSYHDEPQECRDYSDAQEIIIRAAQQCLLEDYWKRFPALQSEVFGDKSPTPAR